MHAHPSLSDRQQRPAVIEMLRRRADQRKTRGQIVPPALRRAIHDYGRYARRPHPGPR